VLFRSKEIESELGAALLDRSQGQMHLTRAGRIFREDAQRMLAFMDGARLRARLAAEGFRAVLRIGLADSLAQLKLTCLLACCREEEPHTEIRIVELNAGEMAEALRQDTPRRATRCAKRRALHHPQWQQHAAFHPARIVVGNQG
jgi:DNA-binding transcriptional LysR family regulator